MPSVHLIYIQCTSTKYFYWNYWWTRAGANVCACAKTTKQEILARLRLRFEWCDIQQNDKMWTNKSTENRTYAMDAFSLHMHMHPYIDTWKTQELKYMLFSKNYKNQQLKTKYMSIHIGWDKDRGKQWWSDERDSDTTVCTAFLYIRYDGIRETF